MGTTSSRFSKTTEDFIVETLAYEMQLLGRIEGGLLEMVG
jgi:hypothetical protein